MGVRVFSATCRMIECTILLLLYRSSHFTISSGPTRRFERSIYPSSQVNIYQVVKLSVVFTLLLVDSQYDDDFITTNTDQFLNASDTAS